MTYLSRLLVYLGLQSPPLPSMPTGPLDPWSYNVYPSDGLERRELTAVMADLNRTFTGEIASKEFMSSVLSIVRERLLQRCAAGLFDRRFVAKIHHNNGKTERRWVRVTYQKVSTMEAVFRGGTVYFCSPYEIDWSTDVDA